MKPLYMNFCCLTSVFVISTTVLAHGVHGRTSFKEAAVVSIEYDDGEPVSYAAVKVYSPESQIPFQTGRTDKNGRFIFSPDEEGEWKVVVNDEMGHQIIFKPNIDVDLILIEHTSRTRAIEKQQTFSRFQSIVTGIALLLGSFGLITLFIDKFKKNPKWPF